LPYISERRAKSAGLCLLIFCYDGGVARPLRLIATSYYVAVVPYLECAQGMGRDTEGVTRHDFRR
jgi:hypothetical protein